MKLALLQALNVARMARQAAVLVTELPHGGQRFVAAADLSADPLHEALETAVRLGKSGMITHDGKDYFLTVQVPPVRIVVLGAVHISQALAPVAALTDFDVIVIDPRTAFATPERFGAVKLLAKWPDEALPDIGGLDAYTALVAVTHDPKIDDPGLMAALSAECFYIGALGSRKTHGKRVERLTAQGFSPAQIARIRAPIGLDIGAVSPAEIAVSIVGEIIAALRKKPPRMGQAL